MPADRRNDEDKAPSDGKISSEEEFEAGMIQRSLTKREEVNVIEETNEKMKESPITERRKRSSEKRKNTRATKRKEVLTRTKEEISEMMDEGDSDKENIDPSPSVVEC